MEQGTELSAHIPDAHEKSTLFYGWYSNRTCGYRKQHGLLGSHHSPMKAVRHPGATPILGAPDQAGL